MCEMKEKNKKQKYIRDTEPTSLVGVVNTKRGISVLCVTLKRKVPFKRGHCCRVLCFIDSVVCVC